jgi:hypothetical protein
VIHLEVLIIRIIYLFFFLFLTSNVYCNMQHMEHSARHI